METMSEFGLTKWSVKRLLSFKPLETAMCKSLDWNLLTSVDELVNNIDFKAISEIIPIKKNEISSYQAIAYLSPQVLKDSDHFIKSNPGIIMMDAATFDYWIDKYKVTKLFNSRTILSTFKPEWKLCKKVYTKTLANEIQEDIQADCFVIKPLDAFKGNGVIIVAKEDLDHTLEYIMSKNSKLRNNPDHSYNYWYRDTNESFIVEKFYFSDPIIAPHLENKVYNPTMRIAFILIYNHDTINIKYLGRYWLLPFKALNEEGSLNIKHKVAMKAPYFKKVEDEVFEEIKSQLNIALPLLYQEMLDGH